MKREMFDEKSETMESVTILTYNNSFLVYSFLRDLLILYLQLQSLEIIKILSLMKHFYQEFKKLFKILMAEVRNF